MDLELVNMKELLREAQGGDNKAIAAINVSNMETIMGLMEASEKKQVNLLSSK